MTSEDSKTVAKACEIVLQAMKRAEEELHFVYKANDEMHLRYRANDDSWLYDLKLEGFTEEQVYYWQKIVQKEMPLFLSLYPELKKPAMEDLK